MGKLPSGAGQTNGPVVVVTGAAVVVVVAAVNRTKNHLMFRYEQLKLQGLT